MNVATPHTHFYLKAALTAGALLLASQASLVFAQDRDEEPETIYEFSFDTIDGNLGATPGGAQDIAFFRDGVLHRNAVPLPQVFTSEGLLSEHDLPVPNTVRCRDLLCIDGQATEARLLVQPDVRYLAQLGFSSGLNAANFKRAPLNLVMVVDKSGSMSGVLKLVQESLHEVAQKLGSEDQISIVLYGDNAHVHLSPISGAKQGAIRTAIDAIAIKGSTHLEEGLAVGFQVARATEPKFEGDTRVMLFTDERPNVGNTSAGGFMQMAREASRDGIGMTTIGVGVQFGAELATQVSSVRGGNLFFFPDSSTMKEVFTEDFETMVTELAYNLKIHFRPPPGLKIAGVYGIPGDLLTWGKDGAIFLEVETIFLSKRKGAIYIAMAPDTRDGLPKKAIEVGESVVNVELKYMLTTGEPRAQASALRRVKDASVGVGLSRGMLLVNQATALKQAVTLHHTNNDQKGAYMLVHSLASLFKHNTDKSLDKERTLVFALEKTLAKLAGYEGEVTPKPSKIHTVTGLPTH